MTDLVALPSAVDWCLLQARVWAPAGRRLLAGLDVDVRAAVDLGCGPVGWLPLLVERWPRARVIGVDADAQLLEHAGALLRARGLDDVELRLEDLFTSSLPGRAFDLVHARALLSTVGWAATQLAEYQRLLRSGGHVVIEEPDTTSFEPPTGTTAMAELLALEREAWLRRGTELDFGRHLPGLFEEAGLSPEMRVEAVRLPPGHPYQLLPIMLAHDHRDELAAMIGRGALEGLIHRARLERAHHPDWVATVTLVQVWAGCEDS